MSRSQTEDDDSSTSSLSVWTFIWTETTTLGSTTVTLTKTFRSSIRDQDSTQTSVSIGTLVPPTTRASTSPVTETESSDKYFPTSVALTSIATSSKTLDQSERDSSSLSSNTISDSDIAQSSTTSASNTTAVASQQNNNHEVSKSALAGIIIGTALATVLLMLMVLFCRRRYRRQTHPSAGEISRFSPITNEPDNYRPMEQKSPGYDAWSRKHDIKISETTSTRTSNTLVSPTSEGHDEPSPRQRSGQSGQWLPMIHELPSQQFQINREHPIPYHERRMRDIYTAPSSVNSSVQTFGTESAVTSAADEAERAQIGKARVVRISRGK